MFDSLDRNSFRAYRVLVVGDLMVDEEWSLARRGRSPEQACDIYRPRTVTRYPGGAANVAANCRSLGAQVTLAGPIGGCEASDWLTRELAEQGIRFPAASHDFVHGGRVTVKRRFMEGDEALMRVDQDQYYSVTYAQWSALLVDEGRFDALLLSDYQKGAFCLSGALRLLIERFRVLNPAGLVAINPKPALLAEGRLPAVDLLVLNEREYAQAMLALVQDGKAGGLMPACLKSRFLVHTLGARGLEVGCPDGETVFVPAVPVELQSPVGCGDATFAAATLAALIRPEAAFIAHAANAAGAVKAAQRGTQPVDGDDLAVFQLVSQSQLLRPLPAPAGSGKDR